MKKVLILGAGASAAYCYRACRDNGIRPHVMADSISFNPAGAFFLHWIPPSIQLAPISITYLRVGTEEVYWRKQWQLDYVPNSTSFPVADEQTVLGWDGRKGIEAMFDGVSIDKIGKLSDSDVRDISRHFDIVFQTFPTQKSLSKQPPMADIYIARCTDTNASLPDWLNKYNNFILYNGEPYPVWVRLTRISGSISYEYSHEAPQLLEDDFKIIRYKEPVPGTEPWDEPPTKNVKLIGRLARWDRKYLSHHAYYDTVRAL